jgi:uncharacterized membrane protein YsdA (DUF1294 family)
MDVFATYLLVINVVTFLLFTIDYLIATRNRDPDTGLMDGSLLSLFAAAGGAVGMLAALALWSRKIAKYNIAWWFIAFACLIVWSMICAARWGFVDLEVGQAALLSGWNTRRLAVLGIYFAAINIVTFITFCVDKRRAESNQWRIRESTLLGLSLMGGSLGGILAMRLMRHKIRTWYFTVGLPAFLVLHIALLAYAHLAGVL